jgi:protein-S-isoprenylcysteine O-methyltransferase Ste14
MKIKGVNEWKSHLPSLKGKKILVIPMIALISVVTSLILSFLVNNISSWNPEVPFLIIIEPVLPILVTLILLAIGFTLIFSVWHRKEKLLQKNRELAYEKGAIPGFAGVSMIFTSIITIFISFILNPVNVVTGALSSSIWGLIGNQNSDNNNFILAQVISSLIIGILGVFIIVRAIETFGLDYAAIVYLYYPEESHLINHEIYSIVRNPLYLGLCIIAFGGLIFRSSFYSIVKFLLFIIFLNIHIRFVEDKELIQRFGDNFQKYMKNVPALIIRPKNWIKLLKFIVNKEI